MAELAPVARQRFFDANGDPLVGGKLYSYQAGTTTPLATYTDQTGLAANTNPVILDANGEADVWLGLSSYKLILKDANDVTQWTVDDIRTVSGEIAAQVATIVVAAGALAASNNLSDLVDVDAALGNLGIKPLTVPVTTSITNSMAATNISGYVFTPGKTVEVFYFVSRNSAAILGNGHLQLVYDGSAWNIVDGGYTFKSGTTAIHGLTFSMSGNQLKVASDASGTGTLITKYHSA
jgi:hypothetical protein